MAKQPQAKSRIERLTRAREVLREAELRRLHVVAQLPEARPHDSVVVPLHSGAVSEHIRAHPAPGDSRQLADAAVFDEVIPPQLRSSGIVVTRGSMTLLLTALAEVLAAEQHDAQPRWAIIFGAPDLGLAAAAEQGIDLDRLVLVPDLGGDAARVIAAALDGVDIVVCGPQVQLTVVQQRRLTARIRRQHRLVISSEQWDGADMTVRAVSSHWHGMHQGRGWLRDVDLTVIREGRGAFNQQQRGNLRLQQRVAG